MNGSCLTFTEIAGRDRAELSGLLDCAERFLQPEAARAYREQLAGEALALLFHEPSTRTRLSFEIAALRLGCDVLRCDEAGSSQVKGENLAETCLTLAAMGVRFFVLRHRENGVMERLALALPAGTALVSAGEGSRAHPTQGLLDALTIRRHRPDLAALTVAIVGDIAHSRVARSTLRALAILGVRKLRMVGPAGFLPAAGELPAETSTELAAGLAGADVVIALRIQRERMQAAEFPDPQAYRERYGITIERLERFAKPDTLLLHPGPVNWGLELDPELAAWPRSLIREQVRNGVAVRMALLAGLAQSLNGDG